MKRQEPLNLPPLKQKLGELSPTLSLAQAENGREEGCDGVSSGLTSGWEPKWVDIGHNNGPRQVEEALVQPALPVKGTDQNQASKKAKLPSPKTGN